jgi:hypothetical protein
MGVICDRMRQEFLVLPFFVKLFTQSESNNIKYLSHIKRILPLRYQGFPYRLLFVSPLYYSGPFLIEAPSWLPLVHQKFKRRMECS